MKPRVVLIDLSALFHPAWRANEHGPVSVAFESTIGGVNRIASQFPDALLAVCCDGKGNWRKAVSAEYKAQRDKLPDVFYAQFAATKERLHADGRLLWEFEGYEADDVIATAHHFAVGLGHAVTIATHDKDLFQLVKTDECDVLSLSTWEIRTEENVVKKFGVKPNQIPDFLALTGDASDNIDGCPGCGPVNAAKLLNRFADSEGVVIAQFDELQSVVGPALARKIEENRHKIDEARKLVTLKTDVPLDFKDIYERREVKNLAEDPKEDADPAVALAVSPTLEIQPTEEDSPSSATPVSVVVEYDRQLQPSTPKQLGDLARYLFNSRLYQKFPTEQAIGAVIMRGRELGIGALTSLDVFHVIEGKPHPYAYLIIAMCRKHTDCEYLLPIEYDARHCVAETKHKAREKPLQLVYTYAQAEQAKLPKEGSRGPNGWLKNPEDMLVKTALCKLGRRIYSDAAMGLISLEEIGEV